MTHSPDDPPRGTPDAVRSAITDYAPDVMTEVQQALHDYADETGWRYLAGLSVYTCHLAVNVYEESTPDAEHYSASSPRWRFSITANDGADCRKRYLPDRRYHTRESANRAATIAITNLLMNEGSAND